MTGLMDNTLKYSILEEYENIIIYGAQKFAVATAIYLKAQKRYCNKNFYVAVSTKVRNPEYIMGIKVYEIDELVELRTNSIVIISVRKYASDVERVLREKSFNNYIRMNYDLLVDNEIDYAGVIGGEYGAIVSHLIDNKSVTGTDLASYLGRFDVDRKLTIDIQIVGHCNLNCQSCNVFSPLVKEEQLDIPAFQDDINEVKRIVNAEDLQRITLLGGEPLLHDNIEAFIKIVREVYKTCELSIFTNGIGLLNKKDDFFFMCKDNRVNVMYTQYPIDLDYKAIEKKLLDYGISYYVFNGITEKKKSHKLFHDLEGKYDRDLNFVRCPRAGTETCIKDHKIFPCSIAPSYYRFNCFFGKNLLLDDTDGIKLKDITSYEEIKNSLLKPMEACRFCGACNVKEGLEWKLSEKSIYEWI